jgi:hypothetical protein
MADTVPRRIDRGLRRGPRQKPGPKPSSPRRANGQFVERLPNDPESIKKAISAYQSGATLEAIGQHYGVSKQAIYGWLLGGMADTEHEHLVTQALTSRIASADDELENASNPLDLSRAREQARFARMDLERRRPHLYGQKQEMKITTDDSLQDRIREARERLARAAAIDVTPQSGNDEKD